MARYFGTDDPTALADHLIRAVHDAKPSFVRNVVPDLDARASRFASDFALTIRRAIEIWPKPSE